MKFVLSILMMFLLGSCTLAENVQKEESRDYVDVVHEVDLVDYEFEERLNSFYESEPIENQELYDLYEGEFPEGERNPQKLRIHWKDARELALAELELQKPIQENWKDATVSERPILVLDRDGGDFYRYYEYRIIKDKKYLGAIRIPAYRRTENFATAEVHLYSDDEKTYIIHPTGWGVHIGSMITYDTNDSFREKLKFDIENNLSDSYLLAYNARKIEQNMSAYKLPPINTTIVERQVQNELNQEIDNDNTVKDLKNRKGSDALGDFVGKAKQNYLNIDQKENKQNLTIGLDKFYKRLMVYPTAKKQIADARKMLSEVYSSYYLSLYGIIYNSSLLENSIVGYKPNNILAQYLKIWYWKNLESKLNHKQLSQLSTTKWNLTEFTEQYNIQPKLSYQELSDIDQSTTLCQLTKLGTPKMGLHFGSDKIYIPLYTEKGKEYKVNNVGYRTIDRTQMLNYFNGSISDQFDKAANAAVSQYNFWEGMGAFFGGMGGATGGVSSLATAIAKGIGTATFAPAAGIGAIVGAAIGIFTGIESSIALFSDNTKKEMDNQFNAMEKVMFGDDGKGICFQIKEANKLLTNNGLEPLSAKDGRDIEYILTYCNAGSTEQRRTIFDKRLYREMAIRCNDWTLRDWRLHISWSTGAFIPIDSEHIQAGAYCHWKNGTKGTTKYNPKI